jgi:hypothetical protein
MAIRKIPWVILSEDATDTARFLIQHAGGVQAAHDAITRAAKLQRKHDHGRRPIADMHWLLIADGIRKRERCSDSAAIKRVADLCFKDSAEDEKNRLTRRLHRKLSGKSLAAAVAQIGLQ